MKRACLLSVLVLVSIVTVLPFIDSAAQREAEAASVSQHHRRAHMSARRYRMWLRRRAMRRRRARALARLREKRRQAILSASLRPHPRTLTSVATTNYSPAQSLTTPIVRRTPQQSTFMMTPASSTASETSTRAAVAMSTPDGWRRDSLAVNGEARFSLHSSDGSQTGGAFLTPLSARSLGAVSAGASRTALRNQIAGVSFTNLRRTVIDKMIQERGWVANDMEREIGGRRVFIVIAQTGDNQAWTYYFTELNGQLYSLAVKAPVGSTASVNAQAEQLLTSLRANNQPAVAAEPQQR